MSFWEFNAAVGGHVKAHGRQDEGLSSQEAEALAAWIDAPPVWH
jgi:hypothetical protein